MKEKDYSFSAGKGTVVQDYSQLELKILAQPDVFSQQATVDDALIREYHERNKRKTDDEKWLKANKPTIMRAMEALGRDKKDFGSYRVSIVTPDESRFDMEKVLEYLEGEDIDPEVYAYTRTVVNETALAELIESGRVDLDSLKQVAWVEKYGTARLTVKQI